MIFGPVPASGRLFGERGLASVLAVLSLFLGAVAQAQTPPTAAEIAGYGGLHRAAWDDDAAAIRRLVASGADLDARDAARRSPAHVAAFACAPWPRPGPT
jgi:hypothetical protein